jgi:hypothetical protein
VRFEDWRFSRWLKENPDLKNLVPDSCCISMTQNCGVRDHPSNIYYNVSFFSMHTANLVFCWAKLGSSAFPQCRRISSNLITQSESKDLFTLAGFYK